MGAPATPELTRLSAGLKRAGMALLFPSGIRCDGAWPNDMIELGNQ